VFTLLLACTPADPVLSALTDGGSWTVTLADAPEGRGITDLLVTVSPDSGVVTGLYASMPEMGHGSDGVVTDLGEGAASVEVNFTMPGWWILDGEVREGESVVSEGFRLEVEVP
jgi:hypothetical protein